MFVRRRKILAVDFETLVSHTVLTLCYQT